MNRFFLHALLAAAFAAGAVALPAGGADDDKPAAKKKPADAKPDWSKFANHKDVVGEVVKADEDGLTLRLPQRAAKGEDLELKYAEGGLVRWKKLPPKVGADGKKANYTPKEMEALKQPAGAPGYAAERTDLLTGHVVEVKLVRPKSVPAAKATPADLSVKYVIIVGETAPPKPMKAEIKPVGETEKRAIID
jgi:hypothetical protein